MKKHFLISLIYLVYYIPVAMSQGTTLISDLADPAQQNKDLLYDNSNNFIGSRFIIDEFNLGSIKLISGDRLNNLLIRYNSFDGLIHCKTLESDKETLLKSPLIAEFRFYVPSEDRTYTFIQLASEFYEKIHESKTYSILKKYKKKLVDGVPPNGYNSGGAETVDRLIDVTSYFEMNNKSKELLPFNAKKKEIIDFAISKGLFSDKKEVKKFTNSNKIDLTTDKGIDLLLSVPAK